MVKKFENSIRLIHAAIEKKYFPCACLEVGDRNGRIFRYIEGNRSIYPKKEPVFENTLFDMASVTKILPTTMLVLKFIEAGKICLTDSIGDFFKVPDGKEFITILNLLTHTSGIKYGLKIIDKVSDISDSNEIVSTILNLEPSLPIGSEVDYSCLGFILLGKILEIVGDDTLDRLSYKYVFKPLEMYNTTFSPKGENIAATDFDTISDRCSIGVVHDHNSRFLGGVAGNAGVFSNLDDMSNFAQMLSNFGKYKSTQYLSKAVFMKALHNYTLGMRGMSQGRGLGFLVIPDLSVNMQPELYKAVTNPSAELFSTGSYGHTGYTGTSVLIDKITGLYVVFLTNRVHSEKFNNAILRFRRMLHNSIMVEYSKNR
jgi:CubicO group peptidase (beta-lactamase class C family)